jgi:hypothetical protein
MAEAVAIGSQSGAARPADPLEKFLKQCLQKGSPIGCVPLHGAMRHIDGVTAVLWYREAPFQIQLFIVLPNQIIPEHTHPNVDSYEVYAGGQIKFSHSGKFLFGDADLDEPSESGLPKQRGGIIRVRPSDLHGGTFGPSGGVFFSVQHWLNGVEPHCVSADYDGVVMAPEHKAVVVFGNAELTLEPTARDAASKES